MKAPLRLGDALVQRGLISAEERDAALEEHRDTGVRLGRVLLTRGSLHRRDLWATLAQLWGFEFVDLFTDEFRPNPELLERAGSDAMIEGQWVPLRENGTDSGSRLLVAAARRPDDAALAAVRACFGDVDVDWVITTDFDVTTTVLTARSDEVADHAAEHLARSRPSASAADPLVLWQKVAGIVAPAAVVAAFVVNWEVALLAVLIVTNIAFAVGIVFKIVACSAGMARLRRTDGRGAAHTEDLDIADTDLPTVTILVPVYHEANVVSEVVSHMSALDYPAAKLQVLVLCEADDVETVTAAKAARPPEFVRIVVVPDGEPRTKPRACNVGLALATGEFLVIFDAEDLPESGQLREMAAAFAAADDDVVCFQARLNYWNSNENILTRMFTLEYSLWFDYMLVGLDELRLPIPLGGTSNHFRTADLATLGGWDPYNVTEDADLGVRAAALGKRVGIIDSTTWEEACSAWRPWMRQRTRWIKGYMVTALVHTRNPLRTFRSLGVKGTAGLVGLIAGTPALFLAAPVVWAFFLWTFLGLPVGGFVMPHWLEWVTFATLVFGNAAMVLFTALAVRRRRHWELVGYALLNPFYWVLHSLAAWRALWQLAVSPAVWEKTPHGIVHGPAAHHAELAVAGGAAQGSDSPPVPLSV